MTCSVDSCERPVLCKHLCNMHYLRKRYNKPVEQKSVLDDTIIERFWKCVNFNASGDCWEWTGYKKQGYGFFKFKHIGYKAHRYSYELHHGCIDLNLGVLHRCANKSCVNPHHLYQGTQLENVHDAIRQGHHVTTWGAYKS